jgi:hypothetical protein
MRRRVKRRRQAELAENVGRCRLAPLGELAIALYREARAHTKAYEANKGGRTGKRFAKVLHHMKVLAAITERYQREVPGAREEIDRILDTHKERQDQGLTGHQEHEAGS